MAVTSYNTNVSPMPFAGGALQVGNYPNGPYFSPYYGGGYSASAHVNPLHLIASITSVNQVVGLVPLYPCEATECRLGKYGSNDADFMLPVFAEDQGGRWGDYKNDYNTWLFNFTAASGLATYNFYLDRRVNGDWEEVVELADNKYGIYYPVGRICDKNYFTGFNLMWNRVLFYEGEGIYRFRVGSSTGSFRVSENHFKIVGLKPNSSPTIKLESIGYGLICPTFLCNPALSLAVNMQNLVVWINNYQASANPSPLFSAVYNAGTGQIDLFGLLAQNCPCSALVTDVSYINYASSFVDGEDSYTELGCFATPPFCLKEWDCYAVDRTTRFEAFYSGGVIGNIDKSLPGTTWSFCCTGKPVVYPDRKSLFTMKFWEQGVIYESTTFTFTPDFGYDLVPPVTFSPGTTPAQCALQLSIAINAYQATLTPPQFSATVPSFANTRVDITNLFGQNIGMLINYTDKDPVPSGNTIQLTLNSLVTYLPITSTGGSTFYYNIQVKFNGGTDINSTAFNASVPISWQDSIRIGGEFGYEDTEHEKLSIKYQTGVVNKVRDEAILRFTWKSSSLPFWFHERFKAYGLIGADKTLVGDYNLNNADYNIKQYSVQLDSGYKPDYKGYRRETVVSCEFKPAVQNLKRSRCC